MADAVVRLLLAPACVSCGAELDSPLDSPACQACWGAVSVITPPWCTQCGDVLPSWRASDPRCARCRRTPARVVTARSASRYEGSLRAIVHAFKYDQRRILAPRLAALLAGAGPDWLEEVDAVIPVPLHPLRSFHRGFNQADDLARQLGRPVWPALRRCRAGPPQASLPAARRHANVRGAFALARGSGLAGRRWSRLLRDRAVLLVDDVMTTGATLEACGRVLQEAGAGPIRALTVARAVTAPLASPLPPPPPSRAPRR